MHIYAFYLLAQFREPKAYPLIIDFFLTPGPAPYQVTQEFVTEDLGRVLASVCGEDLDPIKRLIETPTLNESIRGAGLSAFTTLLVEGKLSREELLDYFQHLFLILDRENQDLWSLLVVSALEIYPNDAIRESIQAAFQAGLVTTFAVPPEEIEHCEKLGPQGCLADLKKQPQSKFVRDTITEIEWWDCFQPYKNQIPPKMLSPQEIRGLIHPEQVQEEPQQIQKKSKSKKSPLLEAKGFAPTPKKKASSKKKRSKK